MYLYLHKLFLYKREGIVSYRDLRDQTLSMQEGDQRVFVEAMKYFMHILLGHEIFFKIFDGPRNTFLCSIFIILFC